jgi:hypothetical protein
MVDGVIVPLKSGEYKGNPDLAGGSGNYPQGVNTYKSPISFNKITDGSSKTSLAGEIGATRFFQAFNGDDPPALFMGQHAPFQPITDPQPRPADYFRSAGLVAKPNGSSVSFGGPHSGVVQFVFCDASVQPISRDVDPTILDLVAQRNDGIPYEWDGTGPVTETNSGPNPF